MKSLIIALIFSSFAQAEDGAPDKLIITGEQANQIAKLSFLAKGSSTRSKFVTGIVKVNCSRALPPPLTTGSQVEDYTCVLSQ